MYICTYTYILEAARPKRRRSLNRSWCLLATVFATGEGRQRLSRFLASLSGRRILSHKLEVAFGKKVWVREMAVVGSGLHLGNYVRTFLSWKKSFRKIEYALFIVLRVHLRSCKMLFCLKSVKPIEFSSSKGCMIYNYKINIIVWIFTGEGRQRLSRFLASLSGRRILSHKLDVAFEKKSLGQRDGGGRR